MTDTVGGSEEDPDFDAEFAKLLRDMEAGRPARVHEPSARARMLQNRWSEEPAPTTPWRGDVPTFGDATVPAASARRGRVGRESGSRRRYGAARVWTRNSAIAVIIGALAFAVIETDRDRSRTASAPAPRTTSTARATAAAGQVAVDEVIPLAQLFPATVPAANGATYTLLQSGDLADCIRSDIVGAKLAGLFAQSEGCVGGEEALYKDGSNDQFNVVVFTLEDAGDALRIMNDLTLDYTDFEVAPQIPPTRSGLPDLSAADGRVQMFAGAGDRLGVFMAQWSDGRASDYSDLESLLTPLESTIGRTLMSEGKATR